MSNEDKVPTITNKRVELEYVLVNQVVKPTVKRQIDYLPDPSSSSLSTGESYYDEALKKNSVTEKFMKMFKQNPVVPIGCLVTAGVLLNGVYAMRKGDRAKSQLMMRYRVAAQGITVLALIAGTVFMQKK